MLPKPSQQGYGQDQYQHHRQHGVGSLPISHPYPPTHRTRPSDPPSESYAYDHSRRQSQPTFSDSPNPYNPQPPAINITAPLHSGEMKELPGGSVAVRGPKIGKKKYAENWTKEDEEAEKVFLQKGMFDWRKMLNWRYWLRLSWWYWYLILIIVCVLVALMTIYNDQIVAWLTPIANKIKVLPAGWTIPIALLFILSFPPLFGQEIVYLLVGAVWGLWVGFGIAIAGTMLGEIGNFYAFKYCLRSQAIKLEETNSNYACLAHIVREGGFFLAFVIRLSAVPGHFSTAVFATCGMNIWVFSAATILTMPKQLVIVYLGVIFVDTGEKSTTERIITYSTLAVATVLTIWSAWYIWKKMNKARTIIWRRERLAEKTAMAESLAVGGAPISRRISYKAMLDQPNDDIEALSPMLPKDGTRYNTPYELQQVHLQSQDIAPITIDFTLPPPSYRSPDSKLPPSRRDSGTLPSSPAFEASPPRKPKSKRRADPSRNNDSSYDIDGPEIRERVDFSYGYNPNASTEQFPKPHPLPQGATSAGRVNRVSMYDLSAEEGYDVGQARNYAHDGGHAEGGGDHRDPRRGYEAEGRRLDDDETGRNEGPRYDSATRGVQLSDPGYHR